MNIEDPFLHSSDGEVVLDGELHPNNSFRIFLILICVCKWKVPEGACKKSCGFHSFWSTMTLSLRIVWSTCWRQYMIHLSVVRFVLYSRQFWRSWSAFRRQKGYWWMFIHCSRDTKGILSLASKICNEQTESRRRACLDTIIYVVDDGVHTGYPHYRNE